MINQLLVNFTSKIQSYSYNSNLKKNQSLIPLSKQLEISLAGPAAPPGPLPLLRRRLRLRGRADARRLPPPAPRRRGRHRHALQRPPCQTHDHTEVQDCRQPQRHLPGWVLFIYLF